MLTCAHFGATQSLIATIYGLEEERQKKNKINLTSTSVYVIKTIVNCYCLSFSCSFISIRYFYASKMQCDNMIYLMSFDDVALKRTWLTNDDLRFNR